MRTPQEKRWWFPRESKNYIRMAPRRVAKLGAQQCSHNRANQPCLSSQPSSQHAVHEAEPVGLPPDQTGRKWQGCFLLPKPLKYSESSMKQHRTEPLRAGGSRMGRLTKSQQHKGCTFGLTSNIFLKVIIDNSNRMAQDKYSNHTRAHITLNTYLNCFRRRKVPGMRTPEGKRAALPIRFPGATVTRD
jgi:hypothetical protein